jgi:hypothetical protein
MPFRLIEIAGRRSCLLLSRGGRNFLTKANLSPVAGLTLAFGTADIAIDLVRKPISNDRTVVAQKIASFAKFYDLTTK